MTDQGPMQPGYRARAEAAEAEVSSLFEALQEMGAMHSEAEARAAAAEAREQALRGRVTALVSKWKAQRVIVIGNASTVNGPAAWRHVEALLSPPTADTKCTCTAQSGTEVWSAQCAKHGPTADTEESDRG